MRKQELVHVHGLLAELRRHFAGRGDVEVPAGAFDAYDAYGVGPTAIDERKRAHEAAIGHLLDGLHTAVTARETAGTPPSSPAGETETPRFR